MYTGKPVAPPSIYLYRWDEASGDDINLTQGTDFVLDHCEDESGKTISGTPTNPGSYVAVYKGAGTYHGERRTGFSIKKLNDLSGEIWSSYYSGSSTFAYTGQPIDLPSPTVYRYDDESYENVYLEQGTHFRLAYVNDEYGNKVSGMPSEDGSYRAVYEGISPYEGSFVLGFNIYDANNLEHFDVNWDDANSFATTGKPIEVSGFSISRYDYDTGNEVQLTKDKDFTIAYYTDEDGNKLSSAPVSPGYYYAVAEGKGEYRGITTVNFNVYVNRYDLSYADCWLTDGSVYDYTGSPIVPGVSVKDSNYNELSADDYVLVYRDAAGNESTVAPTDPGTYTVWARAAEGSEYFGKTTSFSIKILSQNSIERYLYYINIDPIRIPYTGKPIAAPTARIYYDNNDSTVYLVPDVDFKFDHFEDADGKRLTSAPSAIGSYYAVYTGINNYEGQRTVGFDVSDSHDLSYARVQLASYDVPLKNGVAKPQVTVTDLAGKTLTEGTDYVLVCAYDNWDDDIEELATITKTGDYMVQVRPGSNGTYKNETGWNGFSVYDPNDISTDYWDAMFWPSSLIAYDGKTPQLPKAVIEQPNASDYNAKTRLVEGKDFELDHIEDADGKSLGKALPNAAGNYYAVYKGKSPYSGMRSLSVSVYDAHDIGRGQWSWSFVGGNYIYTFGKPVQLGKVLAYDEDNKVSLTEGVDFELDHYEDDEGKSLGKTAPSTSGYYYAVYKGINSYTGTQKVYFVVSSSNDLSQARLKLAKDKFPAGNGPVSLEAKVRDADGILLKQGTDYELVYFDQNGQMLDSAPSAKGSYSVAAQAKDGNSTSYLGITSKVPFLIGETSSEPSTPVVGAVDLTLGVTATAVVASGGFWVGKFVAPSAGGYVFSSTGDYDTYGYLYADATLTDQIDSDDDGGSGNNFRIVRSLSKGETVYLKVKQYGGHAMNCDVAVHEINGKDLQYGGFRISGEDKQVVGGVWVPQITLMDFAGNTLVEGVDYELQYYQDNEGYKPVDAITSPGYYYVTATATPGGAYVGTISSYNFRVYGAYDLSRSELELSSSSLAYTGAVAVPTVAVIDGIGNSPKENTDYTLVYYKYVYGGLEVLDSAPSAIGTYAVSARAKGSTYTGQTGAYHFSIYDPKDLSSAEVRLRDADYYENMGYERVAVYLGDGTSVEPQLYVTMEDEVLDASAYTVAYSNNTAPSSNGFAQVTVTGKAPYSGTVAKQFKVVNKLDLAAYTRYNGCNVRAFSSSNYYTGNQNALQFLGDGWTIEPQLTFYEANAPVPDEDYGISYTDGNGKAISAPSEEGRYHLVLTAKDGGRFAGGVTIPFVITSTLDLSDHYLYPTLRDSYAYSTSYEGGIEQFQISEVVDDLKDLTFDLYVSGVALVENLDYVVSSALDAVTGLFVYTFAGIGSYDGATYAMATSAATAKESFETRSAGFGGRVSNVVYVDENGVLQEPMISVNGLTYGVDFTFGGFVDSDGKTVTTGKEGDDVNVVVKGLGTYAGLERKLFGTVETGDDVADLASGSVFASITNGVHTYGDNGGWYLLKSQTPTVALIIYTRNRLMLTSGHGFKVSQTVNGNNMAVKIDATAGVPLKGTKTVNVKLVDAYSLNDLATRVTLTDASQNSSAFVVGTTSSASLTYSGVSYMPAVEFEVGNYMTPQVTATLKNAAGKTVDAVTGAGNYTLTLEGKGDWTGKLNIPLTVRQASSTFNISKGTLTIGSNTALSNGVARPTVTLVCGNQTLKQGTDYTVEYGSNTTAGARAWIKVTAVKGSAYKGTIKRNFVVDKAASKVLKNNAYELWLQEPSGTEYYPASGTLRAYSIPTGATSGPAVKVMRQTGNGGTVALDASSYSVEYGGLDKPGKAFVKVTGKNGYSGTLSANFYAIPTAPVSIAKATVKLGATSYTYDGKAKNPGVKSVTLNGKTLVVNTDYKVTVPAGRTNARTYTYVVTGIGAYNGTAKASFQINKAANGLKVTAVKTKQTLTYKTSTQTITASKAFKVTGANGAVTYSKKSGNAGISISSAGKLTFKKGLAPGSYKCVFNVKAAGDTNHNAATKTVTITFKVNKAANPMTVKAVTRSTTVAKTKKGVVAVACPVEVKKAQGKVTYAQVKKGSSAALTVNAATGKVSVKKGTKKGTYKVVVKVAAAGNATYLAASKNVTCKVVVK
jgi:hypothetical protein